MGMEQVRTISELESLTFEQRWLMQELLNRPGATELHRSLGEWVFSAPMRKSPVAWYATELINQPDMQKDITQWQR